MAEAVHDRAAMHGRRNPVLQGRKGRGHALHRQRQVQAGLVRHRVAGRRHRRRTRYAVAVEYANPVAGMRESRLILSVSYSKVEELYVQNPAFGFYFLRLASAPLFQNINTLEQRLVQQIAAASAAPKTA